MTNADRRADPVPQQAPRSRCLTSPHCRLPHAVARRFGGFDGLWLHIGPIGEETTSVAVHRAERPQVEANAGHLDGPTRATHRRFLDCSVDLFGVDHDPGGGARRYTQAVGAGKQALWVVYAVAWCATNGVSVRWTAPGFGLPDERYTTHYGMGEPSAATEQEAVRLRRLLDGGGWRRGRPPRWENPLWREIGLRAIERYEATPGLTWAAIAEAKGVPVSTLMDWVRILRDERSLGLRLLDGGER